MRISTAWLTLAALLIVPAVGWTQPAKPRRASAPLLDSRLDKFLRDWSTHAKKITALYAEFERITTDKVWHTKETDKGSARFLAPNLARLDITGPNAESYVLTNKGEIWEYQPKLKQIKVHELPDDVKRNLSMQDGPMPFLFATNPEKAKARYHFEIKSDVGQTVHLVVYPKLDEDKQEFARADLWMNKKSFLLDKMQLIEPNGNEVVFQFKGIWTNRNSKLKLKTSDFEGKKVADWPVIRKKVASPNMRNASHRK